MGVSLINHVWVDVSLISCMGGSFSDVPILSGTGICSDISYRWMTVSLINHVWVRVFLINHVWVGVSLVNPF